MPAIDTVPVTCKPDRRVLVVDDDVDLAESLKEILESRGYTTATAHNVGGAQDAAKALMPNVALLDVNLGRESGLALITTLKEMLPNVLCVMITARAEVGHAIEALRRGAFDYLLKPLHPVETLSRLERCFENLALQQRADKAEADSQAKSTFMAIMSHELRTPLNTIIGFAEILDGEKLGPLGSSRYRDYVQDIKNSGQHLLELITNILDLTRAEGGRLELREDVFDIGELARNCARQMQPRVGEAGLRLELALPELSQMFRGDAMKLRQILFNLLSNAVKFTPAGGAVELRLERRRDRGIDLLVRDTGVGIAPADIPRALQPFTQLDNTLARRHEGSGLGLALTSSLVELHGGQLRLESALGAGTTATAAFPADRTIDEDIEDIAEAIAG
jgi:signal transduction histidine kinase